MTNIDTVRISQNMTKEINFYSRKKEYGFLSNFWRSEQKMLISDNSYCIFPTNEHYYQSEKAKDEEVKRWIASAQTPYLAMMAGRSLRPQEMVDKWEDKKVEIMLKGLRAKFAQNTELRLRLLNTGDAILHEDSPMDMFWGKKGRDMLGILLMQVREEIKDA